MNNIKVLCINAYPIASNCPIGYMTEHIFSDKRLKIFELYSAECKIHKDVSVRKKINIKKFKISVIKEVEKEDNQLKLQNKSLDYLKFVKSFINYCLPIYLENDLKEEIDNFQPQIIYTQGYSIKILKIVIHIAKSKNIPVVVHTLDYWFSNNKIIYNFQKSILKKALKLGLLHLSASPNMVRYIESEFGIKSEFISNCVVYKKLEDDVVLEGKKAIQIGYVGNLTPNRYKTINELCNKIVELGMSDNLKIVIYTPRNQINTYYNLMSEIIEFHESVSQDEVANVYRSFDFLLHVESFDREDIRFTRFSLSTKIAECFCAGVPLVYYGPSNVGVCDFLLKEQVAVVCHQAEQVISSILDVYGESRLYKEIVKKQYNCGLKYFELYCVHNKVYEIFEKNCTEIS